MFKNWDILTSSYCSIFKVCLLLLLPGFIGGLYITGEPLRFRIFLNIFLGITIEALPFLLIGALAVAMAATTQARRRTRAGRMGRVRAAFVGVGLGLIVPVCECGAASIARQTHREGAPVTLSLVFLLAAPIVNPVTILVTWLAFGGDWAIVLGRVGLGLLVAVGIGLLFSMHPQPDTLFKSEVGQNEPSNSHNEHPHMHSEGEKCSLAETGLPQPKLTLFLDRTLLEFLQAAKVALPGIALAALFQAYVPQRGWLEVGHGALFSAIILMLLAALMSVCSSVDAFVALSFSTLFPTGSVLAFMVFGPIINLKSIFLMRLLLRWRTIGLIALLSFQLVLLAAVVINLRLY